MVSFWGEVSIGSCGWLSYRLIKKIRTWGHAHCIFKFLIWPVVLNMFMFDVQQYSVLGMIWWWTPMTKTSGVGWNVQSIFSFFSTILLSNQPNILTFPKLSNYPLTFSYIHHILQFFSDFFSFPTPRGCIATQSPFTASSPRGPRMLSPCRWRPASPARRSLEAELFSPYGAEQSAAGQGNYHHWIVINYIFIYIYIYLCIYIYT